MSLKCRHCFRHLGSQLVEMERLVDMMLFDDFSKFASQSLHRPVTDPVLLPDEVSESGFYHCYCWDVGCYVVCCVSMPKIVI